MLLVHFFEIGALRCSCMGGKLGLSLWGRNTVWECFRIWRREWFLGL